MHKQHLPVCFDVARELVQQRSIEGLCEKLAEILQKNFNIEGLALYMRDDEGRYVDMDNAGEALDAGADDVIEALANPESLYASAGRCLLHAASLDEMHLLAELGGEVPEPYREEVESLLCLFAELLFTLSKYDRDSLTGLLNRHALDEWVDGFSRRGLRQRDNGTERMVLALLDIDHFKSINDRFGHLYGDEVLLLFARLMKKTFRLGDFLFRYGGEEFLVVLQDIDVAQAGSVLERFRENVKAFRFPQVGTVTVSIGAVQVDDRQPVVQLIACADEALYYAKNNGRDQMAEYGDLLQRGLVSKVEAEQHDVELF